MIKDVLTDSNIDPTSIRSFGISSQRASFITWSLKTGLPYHRFITWKDQRAAALVDEWNHSMTMKVVRMGARLLYMFTRNKRFLAGSVLKFLNGMVTMKLIWVLENIPGLRQAAEKGEVAFGGVDSWLLYKLTGKHIMDVSCASGTGIFDPFTMQWADWGINILKLPRKIFPEIVDTMGYFGVTPVDLFGVEIPICCSVADQSGSLFGSGCFYPGDLKITMGTGTFVNVNTGSQPHASVKGLYPVVGWRIKNELVYLVEGASYDTGILVEWAREIGLVSDVKETANIAKEVDDSDGIYFIPAFSGLQAPINNSKAAAGFIGIKPTTKKMHIVRSLLESLVFRIMMLYECLWDETSFIYKKIRIDGGVSGNDFIMQLLSDLTGLDVERSESVEMSILGTAFMAGLESGLWRSREEIMKLCQRKVVFNPNMVRRESYKNALNEWKRAVDRFKNWY
ncbi:putative glycerol kinase 5 isoform X2 [Odontomachus brunneus]|nr:putative glycerol kinase 5 isoform X2 [Odontomachus brunneus]